MQGKNDIVYPRLLAVHEAATICTCTTNVTDLANETAQTASKIDNNIENSFSRKECVWQTQSGEKYVVAETEW